MTFSLLWLPDVLRAAGLQVIEVPGWQNRGHGDEGKVLGVLCFTMDTLILTRRGLVAIPDVVVGDQVWTHNARWRKVTAVGSRQAELHFLKGNGHPGLLTTAEHPFLSYSRWRKRVAGKKVRGTSFEGWTQAKDLKKMLWCSPANFVDQALSIPNVVSEGKEKSVSLSSDLMWVVGYWLGDGYSRITDRRGTITLCVNARDLETVEKTLRGLGFACSVQRTASDRMNVIVFNSRALARWFEQHFGKYSHGKTIPAWLLSAETEWKERFLDGYLTADGGKIKQQEQRASRIDAVSVSKKVAIGIKMLAQGLGISTSLHMSNPEPGKLINGRLINQRPWWTVRLTRNKTEQSHGHFIDGRYVSPCRESRSIGAIGTVYNMSVEEDESYVADGLIVHNCHHTCGPLHGDLPDLNVLVDGRPDLGGPLCNLGLGRTGTYYMIAAGKGWHAGAGNWHGVTDGNAHLIGIEAENAGTNDAHGHPTDPWPPAQIDAYTKGVAAILTHIGAPPSMCAGHKEYALPKGRKDDPNFDMDEFRSAVARLMNEAEPAIVPMAVALTRPAKAAAPIAKPPPSSLDAEYDAAAAAAAAEDAATSKGV